MPMISTDFHPDTNNLLEYFDGQIWCYIDCRDMVNRQSPCCSTFPALVLCQENFLRGHGYLDVFSSATPMGLVPWRWIGIETQRRLCGSGAFLLSYRGYLMLAQMTLKYVSKSTCSWCEDLRLCSFEYRISGHMKWNMGPGSPSLVGSFSGILFGAKTLRKF